MLPSFNWEKPARQLSRPMQTWRKPAVGFTSCCGSILIHLCQYHLWRTPLLFYRANLQVHINDYSFPEEAWSENMELCMYEAAQNLPVRRETTHKCKMSKQGQGVNLEEKDFLIFERCTYCSTQMWISSKLSQKGTTSLFHEQSSPEISGK